MPREIVLNVPSVKEIATRVKNHVIEHKDVYIVGGTCIAVGIVIGRSTSNDTYITNNNYLTVEGDAKAPIALDSDFDTYSPIVNNSTTINQVALGGHQTKIVKCEETGELFASATDAAEQAGVTLHAMSRHINGHRDNIEGNHYRIVALSTADPRF